MPAAPLTCPDCRLELDPADSEPAVVARCPRCRGIWIDPASFQRLCEEETPASGGPGESAAPAPRTSAPARPQERVRYRPCPTCGEIMGRTNFARVSGVILDVCRPHGAWFDRGELATIRRFLREGGLARYDRTRRLDGEARRPEAPAGPPRVDPLDVLVEGGGWDVPRRLPRAPVAIALAALGVLASWIGLELRHPRPLGDTLFAVGASCLYLAWRVIRR